MLSYTISPTIRTHLLQIETLRRDILSIPISPQTELRLRWEAILRRISFYNQTQPSTPVGKTDIVKLLSHPAPYPVRGVSPNKLNLLLYKKSLDYLYQNWLVNPKPVTEKTVDALAQIAGLGSRLNHTFIRDLLDYLAAKSENPLIQAALAYQLSTQENLASPLPNLLAYLFVYKNGYDIRGLLALEEGFKSEPNFSLFLEFFTQTIYGQLLGIKSDLSSGKFATDLPASLFRLTDRQKDILASFDQPDTKITNLKVQRLFGISQITASRDLSRLSSLNLLFPHGRGRSVYYTRV